MWVFIVDMVFTYLGKFIRINISISVNIIIYLYLYRKEQRIKSNVKKPID